MINIHGGDIYSYNSDILDFSSNINPLGLTEGIINGIKESVTDIIHYPDVECRRLRRSIADYENTDINNIICGNGAAEIIFNIAQALKPKRVVFTAPTFMEYENAADTVSAEKNYYYLKEENNFDIKEDILDYIDSTINMLFICNPNNPTGRLIPFDLMIKILNKAAENNVFVLIDECFMDFVENGYSLNKVINKYDNIMILKAFTKMYAMPGLRLGYGICSNEDIIEKIHRARQPWSISVLAEAGGLAALKERELPQKTRDYIRLEKNYIMSELKRLNIKYVNSEANYILIKAEKNLHKKLIEHNILIRDCSNYVGLEEGYYRIAVKKHSENKRLLKVLSVV